MLIIPVVRRVLEKNEHAAAENRALFDRLGVACVNVLGGAGCGKTALLEAVLPRMASNLRIGVLEGDLTTTRDAERIAALGVPVAQLMTGSGCHLTAAHVQKGLARLPMAQLDLLLIENVGNPICPANFDLGEHARVAVLSVTDGDDKPSKYPLLFRQAQLIVLSKCDLLPMVSFDLHRAEKDLRRLNRSAELLLTSARTGEGAEALAARLARLASAPGRPSSSRRTSRATAATLPGGHAG